MCSAGLGARPSADHVPDAYLFLSGLRLRRGLVRLGLVGLVMADGAPGCGAEFAVTGQVPGDPPATAPLMHPLASAAPQEASATPATQANVTIRLMSDLQQFVGVNFCGGAQFPGSTWGGSRAEEYRGAQRQPRRSEHVRPVWRRTRRYRSTSSD